MRSTRYRLLTTAALLLGAIAFEPVIAAQPELGLMVAPLKALEAEPIMVPVSFTMLMRDYIAKNRDAILGDKALVTAYANRFLCKEYAAERSNEFNLPSVLADAESQIKALTPATLPYSMRINAAFGTYDTTLHQFTFHAIDNEHNVFTISDPEIPPTNTVGSGCLPYVKGWPRQINVVIENYDLIDSIPMPQDQAKALLASRATRAFADQRRVGLNVMLNLKKWTATDDKGTATVTADITSANVDDGLTPDPKGLVPAAIPFYTYDAAYVAAHKPLVDKRIEAEHAEKTTGPLLFGPDSVGPWLKSFTEKGSKIMADGTELRQLVMAASIAVTPSTDKKLGVYVNMLDRKMTITQPMPDGTPIHIRFVNKEEFEGVVPLSLEDYKRLAAAPGARCYIMLTPVGGSTIGPSLYTHVDKVLFDMSQPGAAQPGAVQATSGKSVIEIDSKTKPEPYVFTPTVTEITMPGPTKGDRR